MTDLSDKNLQPDLGQASGGNFKPQAANLVENGYLIVPIAAGTKAPKVKGWQGKTFTAKDIRAGVGVKCGVGDYPICAIDIDVINEAMAQKIADFCYTSVGYTVERIGQPPKMLLAYRASGAGWTKKQSKKFGNGYQVEVLGHGQQFVAYAIHPKTGKPYEWIDTTGGLERVNAANLPVITPQQVEAVISYFEQLCIDEGLSAAGGQTSQNARTQTQTSQSIVSNFDDFTKDEPLGLTPSEIKHYLGFVSDNTSYNAWLQMGMILHHETRGGLDGLDLWHDWASTAANYGGYDEHAEKWKTFNSATKEKPTSARTLIKWAKENPSFKEYQIASGDLNAATAIIDALAKLDDLSYHLQKKAKAKLLGITLKDLDALVKTARQQNAVSLVVDVEPYPLPVDGNALANEIHALITAHVACDEHIADVATVWIFFTWCIEASHIAPIAWINAPEKRCGKTTLATLIGRMSRRAISTTNITPAALFRAIDRYQPTLIIDEADTFLNDNEELRGIINAGFSRDNPYLWRTVGDNHEPTAFNTFGAKVISGIGKLPSTIVDRAISLTLRRAMKHEKKKRLRDLPTSVTDTIKAKLNRWTDDNLGTIVQAKPVIPESIYNRDFDTWEILYQIADTIGDEWLGRLTHACLNITGNEPAEPSLNEQLLIDIQNVFDHRQLERIPSKELLNALTGQDDFNSDDWGEHEPLLWATYNHGKPLSDRQLAKRLKDFGIKSKQIRFGDKNLMGYIKSDFIDAFNRYLA